MTTPITEIRWLNRGQIVIGDLQPRKHFEQAKIDELVGSFREHGFDPGVSHLLVRPLGEARIEHEEDSTHWFIQRRTGDGQWRNVDTAESAADADEKRVAAEVFELVLGERRYRASETVGLETVPTVVKELDDVTVLKLQLVENMQRESLTPMEEAMAFKRLNDLGQTIEEIGRSVAMTERVVQDRILLCRHFGTEIATAIDIGEISATHGLVLAQVPSPALRKELLQKVLHPPDGSPAPWPISALRAHVKMDYVIDLRSAKFDTKDATLVPVEWSEVPEGVPAERLFGGACTDCPFNVQSEARVTIPMCTNPQCFQMKEIADHERWRVEVSGPPSHEATARQISTLSHGENAELWNESGRALAFHSPYVELDQAPAASELRADVEVAYIWRHLIKGQAVPIILGRDTAGKVHELVRHDLAKKAAHLNGHKIFRDSAAETKMDRRSDQGSVTSDQHETKTLEKKAAQDQEREIQQAEMAAIVEAAEAAVRKGHVILPKPFWAHVALSLATAAHKLELLDPILTRRGWSTSTLVDEVKEQTLGGRLGLVVELLAAVSGDADVEGGDVDLWADVFGVKLAAVRKAAHTKVAKVAQDEEKKAA